MLDSIFSFLASSVMLLGIFVLIGSIVVFIKDLIVEFRRSHGTRNMYK